MARMTQHCVPIFPMQEVLIRMQNLLGKCAKLASNITPHILRLVMDGIVVKIGMNRWLCFW